MEITRPAVARRTQAGGEDTTAAKHLSDQEEALKVTKQEGDFSDNLALGLGDGDKVANGEQHLDGNENKGSNTTAAAMTAGQLGTQD